MFFLTQLPNALRVFFDTANLTIVHNLQHETLVSVFRVFVVFREKLQKKRSQTAVRKKTRKKAFRTHILRPEINENVY